MMRQAGRFLPEYRAILERTDFLTVCHTPELATEVTLQPVRRLGVDAAILFADILLPLETLGVGLDFGKGVGPRIERPVRRREDLSGLSAPAVDRDLGYVFDAVRSIRRELDGQVPLIGFAGTPWTVAAYLVEGGTSKYHDHLLGWSYRDPQGLARLLEHLADLTVDYLKTREQFGVPIGSFQALQHRAARVYMEVELARSAVMAAARAVDAAGAGPLDADVRKLVSLAKARCSDAYVLATNEGVQLFGGVGMTDEYDIGFYMKRARAAELTFGDAAFHRDRWAMLGRY